MIDTLDMLLWFSSIKSVGRFKYYVLIFRKSGQRFRNAAAESCYIYFGEI